MINLTKKKYILEYEIVNYGFENTQFFTGHSTIFTEYNYAFYEVGNNQSEASENLLENLYTAFPDSIIDSREVDYSQLENELNNYYNDSNFWHDIDNCRVVNCDDCKIYYDETEIYYHLGIRFNLIPKISKKHYKQYLNKYLNELNLSIPDSIQLEALKKISEDLYNWNIEEDYKSIWININNYREYFKEVFNLIEVKSNDSIG